MSQKLVVFGLTLLLIFTLGGCQKQIDVEAEKARLTKELAKIAKEIEKVQQKLANPNFVQKVPPQVLEEHQQRLADWREKQQHAQSTLGALG